MSKPIGLASESAARRVAHAQLITGLAVLPSVIAVATVATAAALGDRNVRALLLARPAGLPVALVIGMLCSGRAVAVAALRAASYPIGPRLSFGVGRPSASLADIRKRSRRSQPTP